MKHLGHSLVYTSHDNCIAVFIVSFLSARYLWNPYIVVLYFLSIYVFFICNMKRPSVKQSMKCKWVQIWQICQRSAVSSIPPQLSIDALNTITWNLVRSTIDLLADLSPPTIKHSCLEYHSTKLGRSTIDLLADLPPAIKHRCLEYCYTKLCRSTPYLLTDLPPPPRSASEYEWQFHLSTVRTKQ